MADATVTIKVNTTEWSLIQAALKEKLANEHYVANDRNTDVKLRNTARQTEVQLGDLIRKLS